MNNKPVFDYPLFAMGFRAFFALAGLSALALIALWNAMANGSLHLDNYYPAIQWHAHEMLLGYSVAVIAGFLLTAVRNWTGMQTANPDQLAALCFLWIYGRVLPFYSELVPDVFIAAVDFAFLPALTYFISKPLLKTGHYKNLIFTGLLLLLTVANGLIHAQILGFSETGVMLGLDMLVAIIVMMILVIAGRVFPFFTERGLSGVICIRNPGLDIVTIVISMTVFVLMMLDVSGILLALVALAAVVLNVMRVSGWYDGRIWFVPLLWVLYVGYGWLILGFVMLALSAYALVLPAVALHAFTVGGIGILTLGMMARVALGHTGRALKTSNVMAIAFLLINLAAIMRVLFPAILPAWYGGFVLVSTYAWLAAFSLFAFYYLPILVAPRSDGEPG
ncbi:short-chain dehydrogenase [Methylomonas lenta]|uniref:Short-chain dehydrogenase n=1 Tax=Methylomonas lenta TaxID=980561 RepID=A0A177N8W7_9GAMM|nr:NnrS family protein [Methylomonas lenta]OAI14377.1 short-chain dehydrogenase [Methylomonas lenta]